MNRGFTLVELLIVIALISVLSVSAISIINPNEQTNKAKDAKVKNLLTEIFQAHLRLSSDSQPSYLSTQVTDQPLSSTQASPFLTYLIDHQEIKSTILQNQYLPKILLTISSPDLTLCYYPLSRNSSKFCLSTIISSPVTPTPINTAASEADLCAIFDPERPNFSFTTNHTSLNQEYGCTNYSIGDHGCDDHYCAQGQRHLTKYYYHHPYSENSPCNSFPRPTEDYCVPEPFANCVNHPLPSGWNDFKYGCTNPRRPYAWVEW